MTRLVAPAALALAGVVAALALSEAALRVLPIMATLEQPANPVWDWIVYDPVLGRTNRAGYVNEKRSIRINQLHFRNDEMPRRKPPGHRRIFCLGDSTTFGIWQDGPFSQRSYTSYPSELEHLVGDGGRVEVINGGVLGNTSAQGVAQLLVQVLPLEPDVVVVRYGNNDHFLFHPTGEDVPVSTPAEYWLLRHLPAAVFRLDTVRLALYAYRRATAREGGAPGQYTVPPADFERNLHRFVDITGAAGVHLAFLDFPYRELERGASPGETFPGFFSEARSVAELHGIHDSYQAIVARVAAETGTPLVRTVDRLRATSTPSFTDYDMTHPNEIGYRTIAEAVRDELVARSWVPAGAP